MGLSLICFIFLLLVSGIVYQSISTKLDERAYPPPGKLVDVGGYRLHINCSGVCGPTVVFDSGMGCNSLEWALVQPEVSQFARACSYDRAGNGWSDESPLERTSENIVNELHNLLRNAEIPGPYILVGHSFGGSNVLLYANKYPDEVTGVILVDSAHEDQLNTLPSLPKDNNALTIFRTYIGVTRLLTYLPLSKKWRESKEWLENFSPHIQKMYAAKTSTNIFIKSVLEEVSLFGKSLEQLRATGKIGDKPLIVITQGKPIDEKELGLSEEKVDQFSKAWSKLQKDLATKSTQGKQIFAEQSGHMITREQPEIIIQAIREMAKSSSMSKIDF